MSISTNYEHLNEFPAPMVSPNILEEAKTTVRKDPTKTSKTVHEDECAKHPSTIPLPLPSMKATTNEELDYRNFQNFSKTRK